MSEFSNAVTSPLGQFKKHLDFTEPLGNGVRLLITYREAVVLGESIRQLVRPKRNCSDPDSE